VKGRKESQEEGKSNCKEITVETRMAIIVTVIAAILVLILIFLIPVLLQVRRALRETRQGHDLYPASSCGAYLRKTFSLHPEIDNYREVIGGNKRPAAAMHHDPHYIQSSIKIDVIEMHQWKTPRICPGPSEERTDGNAIEMIFHQTRS
jgi:hypothetical protein